MRDTKKVRVSVIEIDSEHVKLGNHQAVFDPKYALRINELDVQTLEPLR